MKIKRIIAFLFDILIVSVISSCIFMLPVFKDKMTSYNNLSTEYMEEMLKSGSSDPNEEELVNKQYDLAKANTTLSIINFGVTFAYFCILAFILNGKTLGKKIFGLQIVPVKEKSLNPGLFVLRQILTTGVLFEIISLIILMNCSKDVWFNAGTYLSYGKMLVYFILLGFMIFRDDERGLHDIICDTKVVSTREK